MAEFFNALVDPNLTFLRYAFLTGLLASIAFGVMGTYVVVRRISYIAGAIAHCALGGIGAALFLQTRFGWTWASPMLGATLAALAAAVIIGLVTLYAREREDTVIGALWAIGMAVGLLFLAKTSGYVDPMVYLFGNILYISEYDLWVVLALDALVVGVGAFWYNKFLAVCFDEEFARLRGVRVGFYYLVLLCLTSLTVVMLVRVVGIVMVIALLTLPAAVAGQFARRLWHMMALSVLFCMAFTAAGIGLSYGPDLPSGPVIIVVAGAVYLAVTIGARLRKPRLS
ncbi:MAG TPA: metal ABC transporter permease [Candidatus Hydrogenedentes bacterium]|nr:metal ABC transporter permease [Candidatus Hydrogenedentota bacterium]HIJ73591.1 metal ABC transporter permease [Candidatus Hydrogenedentota bacterium]